MVSIKNKKTKLIFRKLEIKDFKQFKKLFYLTFKKNISFDFYNWRYFKDKKSFCFGAFDSSVLVANVGLVSLKLNNKKNEQIFSRHSSMVLKKYRNKGIFSDLLEKAREHISKKINIIVMWPNNSNHASFGFYKNNIIKKKYYLYKSISSKRTLVDTKNFKINELVKLKKHITSNNNFFKKNFEYFKKRYLLYRGYDYIIHSFTYKNLKSFFIIKKNNDKLKLNYIILDHFGSKKIYNMHELFLRKNQNNLIFLSETKIVSKKYKLINFVNFNIGIVKRNSNLKKNLFLGKQIYLGDTDIFITI